MKHIIGAFSMLFVLTLNLLVGIALLNVSVRAAAAKEYKAAVVAEIENSNFNPRVIAGCVEQASALGYHLEVEQSMYDRNQNVCVAEISLGYTYEIPLLGISKQRVTRGIAR